MKVNPVGHRWGSYIGMNILQLYECITPISIVLLRYDISELSTITVYVIVLVLKYPHIWIVKRKCGLCQSLLCICCQINFGDF